MMKTIELGTTGEQVSQLALGCMLMGTMTSEEDSRTILQRYLDAGGSFLDTANCYTWWSGPGSVGSFTRAASRPVRRTRACRAAPP